VPFGFFRKSGNLTPNWSNFVFNPYERLLRIVAVRLDSIHCGSSGFYALIGNMGSGITESEFARLVDGICDDRDLITKHNPIGTEEEILLWMLLSTLVSYLSLEDSETPCFTGRPDAETYRDAVRFVLRSRSNPDFDPELYLAKLSRA